MLSQGTLLHDVAVAKMEDPALPEEEEHRALGQSRDHDRYPGPGLDLGLDLCPAPEDALVHSHARELDHGPDLGQECAPEVGHLIGIVGQAEVTVEAEEEARVGAGARAGAGAGAGVAVGVAAGAEVEVQAREGPKVPTKDHPWMNRFPPGHLLD